MNRDDRDRLIQRLTEAIASTMYALEGDPNEYPSPLGMGSVLARAAISTIEASGFNIVKKG